MTRRTVLSLVVALLLSLAFAGAGAVTTVAAAGSVGSVRMASLPPRCC